MSSTLIESLYVWQAERPNAGQLAVLKRAKLDSGVNVLCKVERAFLGCGRCISFDGRPPFITAWAEARGYDDPRLSVMVAWALTGEGGRPKTEAHWMSEVMGVDVKLVGEETIGPAFK